MKNKDLLYSLYQNVECGANTAGINTLKKIRNYTETKIQNGETLPKLNIGIYSKYCQYYRYEKNMYDLIHIIEF